MTTPTPKHPPRSVTSVYPALVLLGVAVLAFVVAQNYSATAARFPSIVAVVMGLLALVDLWSRTRLPGRGAIAAFWGTEFDRREMTHDPPPRAELVLAGWVLLCFAAIAVFGILVAAPLFCVLYSWRRGGHGLLPSVLLGGVVLAFEFTVFEWFLDYELYRGLLFSEGGLARW